MGYRYFKELIVDDTNGDSIHPGTPEWDVLQAWIAAGNEVAQEPMQTVKEAQDAQIALINLSCQFALAAIVAPYPALEIPTWPNQYNEAAAYTANSSAPTPTLTAIAVASDQTVAALAASVLTKAADYTAASGSIVGKRQLLTAQINSAQSVAAVKLIVW